MNDFDLMSPKQKAWFIECWRSFPEFEHYSAAACADELPDELWELQELIDEDEDFGPCWMSGKTLLATIKFGFC